MERTWMPCFCTLLLGILVIVFAWWPVSWGAIALTILGVLVIIRGLINKCCCGDAMKKGEGCC